MIIFYILIGLVVLVVGFKLTVLSNTARLNNLRRPDGSYADYDFPGILNGGNPNEFGEPDLKGSGPHSKREAVEHDLYGRPLSPDVIAKRERAAGEPSGISPNPAVQIRSFEESDWPEVLAIVEPIIRAGETYAFDQDMATQEMFRQWIELPTKTYVAHIDDKIVGTYYLKPNQAGGGSHVANCGYMTSDAARGQGVASTMCLHSQAEALQQGFQAMQYNFVISTNQGAIHLWQKLGFDVVGTLPSAFHHPTQGYVDALVMYRQFR